MASLVVEDSWVLQAFRYIQRCNRPALERHLVIRHRNSWPRSFPLHIIRNSFPKRQIFFKIIQPSLHRFDICIWKRVHFIISLFLITDLNITFIPFIYLFISIFQLFIIIFQNRLINYMAFSIGSFGKIHRSQIQIRVFFIALLVLMSINLTVGEVYDWPKLLTGGIIA